MAVGVCRVTFAWTSPNVTYFTAWKPLPVRVTCSPPSTRPLLGETPVTVGASAAAKVKPVAPFAVDVPNGELTWMSTVPAQWDGTTVRSRPSASTSNRVLTAPNVTAVAAERFRPVITIVSPPTVRPDAGE